MQDEIILSKDSFFNPQHIIQLDYFEQGKDFTSNKQIRITMNRIINNSQEICIPKGTLLYSQGERADYCYFLMEGSVAFLSALSQLQCFKNKNKSIKITDLQKQQMIAIKLGIQTRQIKFDIHQLCPGNFFNYRIFREVFGKTAFGISEMSKSGIRTFTAITTDNIKILKLPKKYFESSCSGYEQKRQQCIITPMCKHLSQQKGKQFLLSIFPSMLNQQESFNETIYSEGDFPFAVYYIVKGQVQIFKKYIGNNFCINLKKPKSPKQIKIPVRRIQSGQFFGIQQVLLKQSLRQFSVKTTQDSIIIKIQAKKFNICLDDYPGVKKKLEKYIKQANNNKIKYCEQVYNNVKNQFKVIKQTNEQEEEKILKKIYEEAFEKNRDKTNPQQRISGFVPNIKQQFKTIFNEKLREKNNSFCSFNPQQRSQSSFLTYGEKDRNQSTELGKTSRTNFIIDNDIKIDQKAYKRVMIKMGTYNIQNRKSIFKTGSTIKNNFQPIIDEIVRRHNTFLTQLDSKKRKSFVAEKFRTIVQQQTKSNSSDPINSMYKTWTVHTMRKSMQKYQDSIELSTKQSRPQTHREKMARIQSKMCSSQFSHSQTTQRRQLSVKRRNSSANKVVLVNHMMKPIIYYHNN